MRKRFGKKRAAQLAGLRFQGKHFPLASLRASVSPPEVARLGEVAIAAFLVLHECKTKHGNPVWMGFDTLRAAAGGKEKGVIRLPERTLRRALHRLTITDFLATVGNTRKGKVQVYERRVLVDVQRQGNQLVFTMPVRARLGLDDLGEWGGERGHLAPKMAPQNAPETELKTEGKMAPLEGQDGPPGGVKMAPLEGSRWPPSDFAENHAGNPAEKDESSHQDGPPEPSKMAPIVEKKQLQAPTAETRTEHLLLTEKSVSAAGAAEIFSSFSKPPPLLVLVPPNPPLKAVQPHIDSPLNEKPVAPAVVPAGPRVVDISKLDPDDTPGFHPGQPSLWKGKPQVGPMPDDFAASHGLWAKAYWGKPQSAGPVRYGINGMPTRPPTGCVMYTLPGPPRVPASYDDEAKLKFMLKWYRVACRSRGIEPPRNAGLKGKSRKWFEDALDIFEEHDIAPGAWVAWSLDRVLLPMPPNARKRYVPMLKHLFSPKALVENRWQFRNMEADYTTPHLKHSPWGELFVKRFNAMERDVLASLDRSELAIKAIVARHFPEGYAAALKKSQENSLACEQEVLAQIARGNWLWPLPSQLQPKKRGKVG